MFLNRQAPSIRLLSASLMLNGWLAFGMLAQAATVQETDIKAAVVKHVQETLLTSSTSGPDTRIHVEVLHMPIVDLAFPKAESVGIETDSSLSQTYSDRGVVRVRLAAASGDVREIGVPVKITVQKPVWIAKHPINAKVPLRPQDFQIQTRDVSHQFTYLMGPETNLNGYIARVNLRAGDILDARKVALSPDVVQNSDVSIVLSNGKGMNIAVQGTALASGRIGEYIRVRQKVYKNKYFTARIIDKNRVLVEI